MDSQDFLIFNSYTYPKQNTCRTLLNRVYVSKRIQLLYIILIIVCVFDIVWTIAHYKTFPTETWTLFMDLVLNIIILIDSVFRCYMLGCSNFFNCSQNWIEICVFIMAFPEVIFLLTYMFITNEVTKEVQVFSLCYGAVLLILRPVVFCKRQRITHVQSLHLPNSIIVADEETTIKVDYSSRIDSVDEPTSFNAPRIIE